MPYMEAYKATPAIINAKNRSVRFNRSGMLRIVVSADGEET
jgi:hypothetical protein